MNTTLRFWLRRGISAAGLAEFFLLLRDNVFPAGRRHKVLSLSFYSQFVQPESLCFDVGAHVGDRVDTFLHLGAKVIAIEPQARCVRYLKLRFGRNTRVTIIPQGLAEKDGSHVIYLNRESSMSSMSTEQIAQTVNRPMFSKDRWDRSVTVQVTTLDQLIKLYGEPVFCKIDVEGFESQVLKGLSRPLKALSYEYMPENIDNAITCTARLASLGIYEFNYSVAETLTWAAQTWTSADEMIAKLAELAHADSGGDVYARIITKPTQ